MFGFTMRAIAAALTFFYTLITLSTCSMPPPSPLDAAAPAEEIALGSSGGEVVTVRILQSRGEIGYAMQQAAVRYGEVNPNIRVTVQTVSGPGEYRTARNAKLVAGQVDLFHISGRRDWQEQAAYVQDLSGLPWLQDALEGTLDAVSDGEGVYGVPYSLEGAGLIVDRRVFQAAGVSLDGIISSENLLEAFYQVRQCINDGTLSEDFPDLRAVTEFPAQDREFMNLLADVVLSDAFETPSQAAEAQAMQVAYPEGSEGFVRLLAGYTVNPWTWSNLNEVAGNRQVEMGIGSGRIAAVFQNVDCYRRIAAVDKEGELDLALLPVPLEGMDGGGIYTGVPVYWAVNSQSDSEVQAAAGEFLTWLYQSKEGNHILAREFGAVSVFRNQAEDTGVALHRQMLQYVNQGRTRAMIHNEFPPGWGEEVFAENIRSYLNEEVYWNSLVKDLESWWHSVQ